MTFSKSVEAEISKAISKMTFAPTEACILTPLDRANQAEKAIRSLVKTLLLGKAGPVAWVCPTCEKTELVSSLVEGPTHRHGKYLSTLRRVT